LADFNWEKYLELIHKDHQRIEQTIADLHEHLWVAQGNPWVTRQLPDGTVVQVKVR